MLRISLLAAALLVATGTAALAQQTPAAGPNTTPVNAMPTPPNLLADIYVARAAMAFCDLVIDQAIINRMNEHETNLELQLGIDDATATRGFDEISAALAATPDSCKEGGEPLKTIGRISQRYTNPS